MPDFLSEPLGRAIVWALDAAGVMRLRPTPADLPPDLRELPVPAGGRAAVAIHLGDFADTVVYVWPHTNAAQRVFSGLNAGATRAGWEAEAQGSTWGTYTRNADHLGVIVVDHAMLLQACPELDGVAGDATLAQLAVVHGSVGSPGSEPELQCPTPELYGRMVAASR